MVLAATAGFFLGLSLIVAIGAQFHCPARSVGQQGGCMVHNTQYDFNDRVLSTGATYWVKLVERWLAPA